MCFVAEQIETLLSVDGTFDGMGKRGAVRLYPGSRLTISVRGFLKGNLATGQRSARSEGIANHSTGDLHGLVASAHQPG
jgi:hypothetical protein